jgi:Family of unknown function (DUF6325)
MLAQRDLANQGAHIHVSRWRARGPATGPPGGAPSRQARRSPHAAVDAAEADEGEVVSEEQLQEMGPIDYVVLEWPREQPTGDVVPLILDVVDRGIIRILDIAAVAKAEDGSIATLDLAALEGADGSFAEFDGASAGLLGDDDLEEAAEALAPGTSAAVLVWENRWAAPIAVALRRSGGQLVASGRLHVQAVLASLDAVEATN